MRGLTGNLSFDEQGNRRDHTLQIVQMTTNSEMTQVQFSATD